MNSEKVGFEFVNATVVNENSVDLWVGESPHYISWSLKCSQSIVSHMVALVLSLLCFSLEVVGIPCNMLNEYTLQKYN